MIYQDVKRFLKQYLKQPSISYEWEHKDNLVMFAFLQKRYSDDYIDHNAMEIREAFRHFLEPLGNALVRYNQNIGITYKVFPYHLEPTNSKHLKTLINIVRDNRRSIDFPHNGRHDQIALMGKIRRAINAEIIETNENINKRELARYAIKEALGLGERDVVLHLKKKYIVKLFQENSFLTTTYETKTELIHSIDEFQLQSDYEEFFRETSLVHFLDSVMVAVFNDELNFETISNAYYENNALIVIKKEIVNHLQESISDNAEYLKAFAGYILKLNVIPIHERIAIEIFEKITSKSTNARHFLNYYTGQIYVENGKRYMIPEIVTEDGKHWNINSLISTSTIFLKARAQLRTSKVQRENCEQKIAEITPDYTKAKHDFEATQEEIKIYQEESNAIEENMFSFKEEVALPKHVKRKNLLQVKMQENKQHLKEIQSKINILLGQKVHKEKLFLLLQARLLDHMRDKKIFTQKINSLEKELSIGSDAFNSILTSVVKALMKRKSEID